MAKITLYHVWGKNHKGQEVQLDSLTPVRIGEIVYDKATRHNYKVIDYARYNLGEDGGIKC